jgi:hypothetical protein
MAEFKPWVMERKECLGGENTIHGLQIVKNKTVLFCLDVDLTKIETKIF